MRGIDPDGIAGFQCRALGEEQGQPGHAGLDDGVHVGVAGDDISETGLRNRAHGKVVAGLVGPGRRHRQHPRQDQDEGEGGRRRAPSQQARKAAAEQGDHDRIDQEQRERGRQQHAPEIARLGIGVAGTARTQARCVERCDPVGGRQRIHRERSIRRAIKSRRVIGSRVIAVSGRQRPGGRGRRAERTESVERVQGGERLLAGLARNPGTRGGSIAGHIDDSPQHLDEGA